LIVRDLPQPIPSMLSGPFWEAARDKRLVLQRCDECGAYRWTPQILCVRCHSEGYSWSAVSGHGHLYSFTIVHRAPAPAFVTPYIVAVVRLEEGPLLLTNIVDCDPCDLHIDMRVEVVFEPISAAVNVYRFRPRRS
jgi:uncharacterized protein